MKAIQDTDRFIQVDNDNTARKNYPNGKHLHDGFHIYAP